MKKIKQTRDGFSGDRLGPMTYDDNFLYGEPDQKEEKARSNKAMQVCEKEFNENMDEENE